MEERHLQEGCTITSGSIHQLGAANPLVGQPMGSYTVVTIDANGCTDTATDVIDEPDSLTVTVTNLIDISCFGAGDGSALATVTGGTGPGTYEYNWSSNGQGYITNNNPNDLGA